LSNTYLEVRIKACTGEYTLLKCDTGDYNKDRVEAAQILSVIGMLVRTGRAVGTFRLTAPEDWFANFSENGHVAEVKISRVRTVESYLDQQEKEIELRNPVVLRTTISSKKFSCEHIEESTPV
jgi:hypothetical protein